MHEKAFLNDAQYEAAKEEAVRLAPAHETDSELAPEAVLIAKKLLLELEPERGPRGGFTITTTIDPHLQAAARKALRENVQAYDKRHALVAPLKAPSVAQAPTRGKKATSAALPPVFDGTPSFESHKVFNGVVVSADDVAGTIDVRVGTVLGSVKVADYKRYNPQGLSPTQFAEVGARVRVSLLAPIPNVVARAGASEGARDREPTAKVPLRLELGPESASVTLDVRTRQVLALVGNYEGAAGGLDRATQSRRQPGSTFKPILYSYAIHARRYTPATLVDVQPTVFAGNYKPSNYEGWTGKDPLRLREVARELRQRRRGARPRGRGARERRRLGEGARHRAPRSSPICRSPWARTRSTRSSSSAPTRRSRQAACTRSRASSRASSDPTARTWSSRRRRPPRRVLDPAEAYVTTSLLQSVDRSRHRHEGQVARAPDRRQDRHEQRLQRHLVLPAIRPRSRASCGSATMTTSRSAPARPARRRRCPRGSH